MKQVFSITFLIGFLNVFSNVSLWENVSNNRLQIQGERKIIPQRSSVVKLEDAAFRSIQLKIPSEESGKYIVISLPLPDGSLKGFKVFERTCMEKELSEKYPSIKTYQGVCVDDPFLIAKLDYTEFGFHAMVFSREGIYFIDPYTNVNTGIYNCYYKKDYLKMRPDLLLVQHLQYMENQNEDSHLH